MGAAYRIACILPVRCRVLAKCNDAGRSSPWSPSPRSWRASTSSSSTSRSRTSAADFGGASVGGLSWVLNAYAIVFAALLVPAGRLADRVGRRRGFLAGLALFSLGSALCGLAPSVAMLVAARVLQAAGAALLVPTSLALLLPEFEPRERPAGDRDLGRRRRRGRRGRPAARRPARAGRLAARVPRQPARRRLGAVARRAAADRDARPERAGPARLARHRAARGVASARSRSASCRRPSGAGATRARSPRSRGAAAGLALFARALRAPPLARRRPGDAARALVRDGQRRRDPVLGRVRRDAALQRAVHDRRLGASRSCAPASQLAPGPALAAITAVARRAG